MTAGYNAAGAGFKFTHFTCSRCGIERLRKDPGNNPFKLQIAGHRICPMCGRGVLA